MSDSDDLMDEKDDLEDDSASDGDSRSDNSAPSNHAAADKGSSDKRVDDLMAKWQSEQSRANKLQKELEVTRGAKPADGPQDKSADGGDPASAEFIDFVRDDARRRIFESEPRLGTYGLDQSAITGSTLDEMKASLKRQIALVDGMETRVRADVLAQHGLNPEVTSGSREKPYGFADMSNEEFEKFLRSRDSSQF